MGVLFVDVKHIRHTTQTSFSSVYACRGAGNEILGHNIYQLINMATESLNPKSMTSF